MIEHCLHVTAQVRESIGGLAGKVHLIMAGGYDERVTENKEYYLELRALASHLSIQEHVTFVRSFSAAEKLALLNSATCLLYTPDREHFGIVPVEAMYMKCPVIAVSSGGPLETVQDGHTGFLCKQTDVAFANPMLQFISDSSLKGKLGDAGKCRMIELFSYESYTKELDSIIQALLTNRPICRNR